LVRRVGQGAHEFDVGEVAGHNGGPAAGRFHAPGHFAQLLLGPGGQHDVGPASARATAEAAPMPRPLPVTIATWSVTLKRSRIMMAS